MQELYSQTQTATTGRSVEVSKVLRNTYMLLGLTLLFSAFTAGVSMAVGVTGMMSIFMWLGAIALVWFVLPRTAHSTAGIFVVFAFTGLLGAALAPTLTYYLSLANGGTIVMQALGGTALVFFILSGYVLTTGKDFSFMGGFLITGLIVAVIAILAVIVMGLFGINVPGLSLAISAVVVLLMSGFILYDTSRIIHGGETNYLFATTALYLDIFNLFVHLLHLIGVFSGDD